ncbi:MAG TPA: CopD family protein [Candidatus Binataceae bacterium]|nr:CopD family protein [Candidatus Binataceae bacterium]
MTAMAGRALAEWPALAAQAIVFGTAAFALTLAHAPRFQGDRLGVALTGLWRAAALVAVAFMPLILLTGTASMADMPTMKAAPFAAEVVRETHFGHVWLYRFGAAMILAALAWAPMRGIARTISLCGVSGAMLALTALAGHAIDHGPPVIAVYVIHEMAASMWIGAVLALWIGAIRGRLGDDWVMRASVRVSSVAAWSVLAIVASGVYTAYVALDGDPSRLLYSAYGRALTVKLAATALVLLIGGYNRFFVIPAIAKPASRTVLVRNVGIESLMLAGVLGLAALLANTPPAH